jgi:hypothetical protein
MVCCGAVFVQTTDPVNGRRGTTIVGADGCGQEHGRLRGRPCDWRAAAHQVDQDAPLTVHRPASTLRSGFIGSARISNARGICRTLTNWRSTTLGTGRTILLSVKVPRALRGSRSHSGRREASGEAVLGEAPEELCFTREDLERGRKFSATTRRECPGELRVEVSRYTSACRSSSEPAFSGLRAPLPISAGHGDSAPDCHSVKQLRFASGVYK